MARTNNHILKLGLLDATTKIGVGLNYIPVEHHTQYIKYIYIPRINCARMVTRLINDFRALSRADIYLFIS